MIVDEEEDNEDLRDDNIESQSKRSKLKSKKEGHKKFQTYT